MSKYLLRKIVTKTSVWEVNADSVSDAIRLTEFGNGKQIGWEQSETIVKIVSEELNEDRNLIENKFKSIKDA